jgi:predicted DNA-binding protein YlxM (UPF0122 family)
MKENVSRKAKIVVPNDVFLKEFLEFAKQDKSIEELAQSLNLSQQGCYQKLRKIRKDLSVKQIELPEMRLKTERKTKTSLEKLIEIVQSVKS